MNQSKENQPPLIIKAAPVKSAAKKAIQSGVSHGGGKRLFTCKVCEKSFVDMRTFSLHLETHSAQQLSENYVQSNPRNPGILKANGGSQLILGKLTKGGKATLTCPHCSTAFTDKVIFDRYTHYSIMSEIDFLGGTLEKLLMGFRKFLTSCSFLRNLHTLTQ